MEEYLNGRSKSCALLKPMRLTAAGIKQAGIDSNHSINSARLPDDTTHSRPRPEPARFLPPETLTVSMMLPVANFESPSLQTPDGSGPAFEMKFLIDESLAQQVEAWGHARLQLDPNGIDELNGGYRTTTLYTDTPTLDVYRKSRKFRSRKYRVRRYGDADWLYVERKTKRGEQVAKRRSRIVAADLGALGLPTTDETWDGAWFRDCLRRRQLEPVSQITYERLAFGGQCEEGPLRLTFDRNIHGTIIADWTLAPFASGPLLLNGFVIMELKFRTALPSPFKLLVQEFQLTSTTVSKYRLCREQNGAVPTETESSQIVPPTLANETQHAR